MNKLCGYKLIAFYLGTFMIMIGCIILFPLIMLMFYPEDANEAYCFLIPGISSIFLGYLIRYFLKHHAVTCNLEKHQDSILVVLVWMVAIVISAFPWMLTGKYNFTQAVFECTSGYTTTGLTVVDVTKTSHLFLFYRSVMLFVGGVGLVLVLTAAISDRYGLRLYSAEGHPDKLLPNLRKSARVIISIYSGYILLGTIAYVIAGMPLFDAINHSISALSTGGFSTQPDSILHYHSIPIDIITDVLMLLGSTNFMIHLYLFRGEIKKILTHCEIRFMVFFTIIGIAIMSIILIFNNYKVGESINVAAFQFISAITTTGFSNVPTIGGLPVGFIFAMIILMLIGAGIGSTGGGIKQYRFIVGMKGMWYNIQSKLHMRKTVSTNYISKLGSVEELTDEEVSETHNFILLYLIIFFIGTFIFTCFGYSVQDSAFEFASSLGTVGVSIGVIQYTTHPVLLWTSIIGMFIGRLEILVVFNAFSKVRRDIFRVR